MNDHNAGAVMIALPRKRVRPMNTPAYVNLPSSADINTGACQRAYERILTYLHK